MEYLIAAQQSTCFSLINWHETIWAHWRRSCGVAIKSTIKDNISPRLVHNSCNALMTPTTEDDKFNGIGSSIYTKRLKLMWILTRKNPWIATKKNQANLWINKKEKALGTHAFTLGHKGIRHIMGITSAKEALNASEYIFGTSLHVQRWHCSWDCIDLSWNLISIERRWEDDKK